MDPVLRLTSSRRGASSADIGRSRCAGIANGNAGVDRGPDQMFEERVVLIGGDQYAQGITEVRRGNRSSSPVVTAPKLSPTQLRFVA